MCLDRKQCALLVSWGYDSIFAESRKFVLLTGHRPFSDLKKNWTSERRQRNAERKAELAAEYATFEQFRVALGISQEQLADLLDVQQFAISKLERRN